MAASQQIIGWLMLFWDVSEEREQAEQICFFAARHTNFNGSVRFYVAGVSVILPAASFRFSKMEQ